MINMTFMKNRSAMFFSSLCASLLPLVLVSGPTFANGLNELSLNIYDIDGAVEHFDRERLEALPQLEFTTETLWTSQENHFSGPSLKTVLEAGGITEGDVEITAANGYALKMDLDEDPLTDTYPIIATRLNGQEFPIWEKGPLWIIYPFVEVPRVKIERANALSVWQLISIRQMGEGEEIEIDSGKP